MSETIFFLGTILKRRVLVKNAVLYTKFGGKGSITSS